MSMFESVKAQLALHLWSLPKGVIKQFGTVYMRRPTPNDLIRLLQIGEERGLQGIIENIDCMFCKWKTAQKRGKPNIKEMRVLQP